MTQQERYQQILPLKTSEKLINHNHLFFNPCGWLTEFSCQK